VILIEPARALMTDSDEMFFVFSRGTSSREFFHRSGDAGSGCRISWAIAADRRPSAAMRLSFHSCPAAQFVSPGIENIATSQFSGFESGAPKREQRDAVTRFEQSLLFEGNTVTSEVPSRASSRAAKVLARTPPEIRKR